MFHSSGCNNCFISDEAAFIELEATQYALDRGMGHFFASPFTARIGFPALTPDDVDIKFCLQQQERTSSMLQESKINLNSLLKVEASLLIRLLNEANVCANIAWSGGHLCVLKSLAKDAVTLKGVSLVFNHRLVILI
jgi:hypothetical protein